MKLNYGTFDLKLICSILCLTFFAHSHALAETEAEAESPTETVFESTSQPDTLQRALSTLRQNGNPNSTAFADKIERLMASGELHIVIETKPKEIGAGVDEACGWVDVNEGTLDHLHLSATEKCAPVAHLTLVHEYEHIRIYREEALPTMLDFANRHVKPKLGDLPQSEIDLLSGYIYYAAKMNGKTNFTNEQKEEFNVYLLFKIYTETKAYLTSGAHIGNFVLRGMTGSEISDILTREYIGALLNPAEIRAAVNQAMTSQNYQDFILKTSVFRSSEFVLKNLNMSAPAN